MSTKNRKYILYDINVIGDRKLVDLVLNHRAYFGMMRLFENELAVSPAKELMIKSQLRSIKQKYPDRPLGIAEYTKDMFASNIVQERGYFSYIHCPSSTLKKLAEYSYRNDFLKGGKVNHSLSNQAFKKLSDSEKFDYVVEWLIIGGGAAAFESYLLQKLTELTTPKKLQEAKPVNKNISPKYQKLRELFINDVAYTECMDALRKVKGPIISDDNRYLLGKKQKGAFTCIS